MLGDAPFVLLDDAREEGASDATLCTQPVDIFVARDVDTIEPTLATMREAQRQKGGTLAGYLAYEAGHAFEDKLKPLAAKRTGATGPLAWFGLFADVETIAVEEVANWLAAQANGPASIGPLQTGIAPGNYARSFAKLQETIRAGDIYQANLTLPLLGAASGDPLALYAAIRPSARAGYGGLIFDGSHWLLSFSPELFFSLKDRSIKAKPMKGTRPRGASAKHDSALAAELAASTKDKAENLMIVDLMRNDIGKVAKPGSVRVEAPFAIESYPTVHQMVSTVRAELAENCDVFDLLRATFPCGSITGAPKIRAMELIDEVEPFARGPYCGAIGRIEANGDAAFNVAIRTIRLTPGENDRHRAVLGVGGAIVADSAMLGEWRECGVKGKFVRDAANGCDLIETMRFEPDTGIALLELHLERIKASAAELGFAFDRHATRNQIQALCFELESPAKVRLVLARSGATALETAPLPAPLGGPAKCAIVPMPVDPSDWRLRHKTTDRGFYEDALALAHAAGADEALLLHPNGQLTEGCFTNIFVERDGSLETPPADLGLLPGILRQQLLDAGQAGESAITPDDLAGGFQIGNAVRGLMPAVLIEP